MSLTMDSHRRGPRYLRPRNPYHNARRDTLHDELTTLTDQSIVPSPKLSASLDRVGTLDDTVFQPHRVDGR